METLCQICTNFFSSQIASFLIYWTYSFEVVPNATLSERTYFLPISDWTRTRRNYIYVLRLIFFHWILMFNMCQEKSPLSGMECNDSYFYCELVFLHLYLFSLLYYHPLEVSTVFIDSFHSYASANHSTFTFLFITPLKLDYPILLLSTCEGKCSRIVHVFHSECMAIRVAFNLPPASAMRIFLS